MPKQLTNSRLEREIQSFIQGIPETQFDYFLAVGRKGLALLRVAWSDDDPRLPERVIPVDKILYSDWERLKGARVLVVEDAIFTGEQIEPIIHFLKNNDAEVKVAAFIVSKQVPSQFLSQYSFLHYRAVSSQDEYRDVTLKLTSVLWNKCLPLDYDHIVVNFEYRVGDLEKLLGCIENFGHVERYSDFSFRENEVLRASLFIEDGISNEIAVPEHIRREGVIKIRFYFTQLGRLVCAPMAFYKVKRSASCPEENCAKQCNWSVRFCKTKAKRIVGEGSSLCQECYNFNASLAVTELFLPRFMRHALDENLRVQVAESNQNLLRMCYHIIQDNVFEAVSTRLALAKEEQSE